MITNKKKITREHRVQQSWGISTRVVRDFINFIMNIKRYVGRLSYRREMKLMKMAARENISLRMFSKFTM